MVRCSHVRDNGIVCKKSAGADKLFCHIHHDMHISDSERDEMSDRESDESDVEEPDVEEFGTDAETEQDTNAEAVMSLIQELGKIKLENEKLKSDLVKVNDKNNTLSQAVDVLLEEKKAFNAYNGKHRHYTEKGLRQRALIEHYHHKKSDPVIMDQITAFYNKSGISKFNQHGVKICIDEIFDKASVEEKEYWTQVAKKYFESKMVFPR